jgi:uncharacterized protein YegP (UPF0339 family)
MKIVISKHKQQFKFTSIAKNGKKIGGGELYVRSNGALKGAQRFLKRLIEAPMDKFEFIKAKNGEFMWRLRGRNGEVIAWTGETHKNLNYCKAAIKRLKEQAVDCLIVKGY